MPTFDVHVFLVDCFLQRRLEIRPDLVVTPFQGPGSSDIAEVMDRFGTTVLGQTPMPPHVRATQAAHGADKRPTVVISLLGLEGPDRPTVVRSTQDTVLAVQNALSLLQKNRGNLAGVYVIRTDTDPYECYVEPRVAGTRQIHHLGPQNDEDILWAATEEALRDPLVDTYLSLYSDVVHLGDGLRPQLTLETRLAKIWTLLETMSERLPRNERRRPKRDSRGNTDVAKIAALYGKYEYAIRDVESQSGPRNILDVAYLLRGVFVHFGSCSSVTSDELQKRCERWGAQLGEIVDSLEADCGHLLSCYIAAQIRARHPELEFGANRQLTTILQVSTAGEGSPPVVTEIPGAAAIARRAAIQS